MWDHRRAHRAVRIERRDLDGGIGGGVRAEDGAGRRAATAGGTYAFDRGAASMDRAIVQVTDPTGARSRIGGPETTPASPPTSSAPASGRVRSVRGVHGIGRRRIGGSAGSIVGAGRESGGQTEKQGCVASPATQQSPYRNPAPGLRRAELQISTICEPKRFVPSLTVRPQVNGILRAEQRGDRLANDPLYPEARERARALRSVARRVQPAYGRAAAVWKALLLKELRLAARARRVRWAALGMALLSGVAVLVGGAEHAARVELHQALTTYGEKSFGEQRPDHPALDRPQWLRRIASAGAPRLPRRRRRGRLRALPPARRPPDPSSHRRADGRALPRARRRALRFLGLLLAVFAPAIVVLLGFDQIAGEKRRGTWAMLRSTGVRPGALAASNSPVCGPAPRSRCSRPRSCSS